MEDKTGIHADSYIENQFNMFSIVNNGASTPHKRDDAPIIKSIDVDDNNLNNPMPSIDEKHESPVLSMLQKLINMQKGKGPKAILLPYKGAIEAGIPLPMMNFEDFNTRFGTKISKSSFSNWINETQDRSYTPEELEPYINMFKALI